MKQIILIILLTISSNIAAASFDCSKVTTYVEKTVCSEEQLSDIDSSLSNYYNSLLSDLKKYPNDKGNSEIVSFQKSWLSYRNQCKTPSCIFDLYALQLSDLYNNHVSIDGKYTYFTQFNTGKWFQYVLKSYGIKRGIIFGQAVQLLQRTGWHLQKTEDGQVAKDGVFCGSGWQAVCHVTFKKAHKHFELIVFKPGNTWLVDTNNGGVYAQ
ncbi:lysozyme inhibitor LprI family protein [Vibrio salinus]|uniref:lysozyme inhibitor LprI family protein n=1 Tax=Vibrio salinus TaxID=2899784 RepID=UPI001E4D1D9C|nr:hypothetical protein [Vibrio salinus]MCE0492774.1 hypothetical protein [Vibrio salinus]